MIDDGSPTSNATLYRLPLDALFSTVDLRWTNPWGLDPIVLDEIEHAWQKREAQIRRDSRPFDWQAERWDKQWDREDHVDRIALMVHTETSLTMDPVILDVGQDGEESDWPIVDGHHRILAAWLRGELFVRAHIHGNPETIQRWFGAVAIEEPQDIVVRGEPRRARR